MSGGHDRGSGVIRHERPLWWSLGLTLVVLVAEVVGGILTNSLALLSDAAHRGTDALALGISLFAVRLSRRPPDARRTYGYARMEALGALVNGALLFIVAGYVLWEAALRFRDPPEVASTGMLVVATIGLVVNLIAMRLRKAGSGESLNLKGAYLMTAHVVLAADAPPADEVRHSLVSILHERFGVDHATLQMETRPCSERQVHP